MAAHILSVPMSAYAKNDIWLSQARRRQHVRVWARRHVGIGGDVDYTVAFYTTVAQPTCGNISVIITEARIYDLLDFVNARHVQCFHHRLLAST